MISFFDFAIGGAAGEVLAGAWAVPESDDGDQVEGAVGCAVAACRGVARRSRHL
jgi:hypothetical protein